MDTNYSLESFGLPNIDQPTPDMDEVSVTIHATGMLKEFSRAFIVELQRRNDLLVDKLSISEAELISYFTGILKLRVDDVNYDNKFRKFESQLLMPAWIQFTISQIGKVLDSEYGLEFIPKMDFDQLDIDTMLATSRKLRYFRDAGLQLLDRAFPRSVEGDKDFMTMAVFDRDVRSYRSEDPNPLSIYAVGFVGSQLVGENPKITSLYRKHRQQLGYVEQVFSVNGGMLK